MSKPRRGLLLSLLVAGAVWVAPPAARAEYPDHPIRLIVPQAPGSATDTVARLLVSELAPYISQSIVIENRPGAVFTIGLELLAKSAPDGYTLGMGPIASLAMSPHMISKLPYDPVKSFAPVAIVANYPMYLSISADLPVKSVAELLAYAKANPGK
ncbi:MAG: tripartite tricarboxylate transporter substrate binding protein, partial [Rhizobiales bacterium]|nr:tripartite tricarboxylate transporter substrate binding protein [Hyphomicrobiales bacterium]